MILRPAGKLTEAVGQYVGDAIGAQFQPGTYSAMMVVDEKLDIVAGLLFNNFRMRNVEMTVVSETPVAWRPHVMAALAHYIFVQLDCIRVTCFTSKRNSKARKFLEHAGFELEGRIRRGYDGEIDALVYGLLAQDCRFLAD